MKLTYIISEENNPYANLALEEYLLKSTEPDECILYLWQNAKTVVIGYNQNAWKECKVEELKEDKGSLARRHSGGGAVFHDLGNLNFTFLVRKEYYDLEKQTEVILRAVNRFGIPAERTGRNDLTVEGKKFSGNAFYESNGYCYHHGTILLDVNKEMMSKYLKASMQKLQSKGVNSVRSRVCNLNEFNDTLNVEAMKSVMIEVFGEVYGGEPKLMEEGRISNAKLEEIQSRLSSWEWVLGREIPFNTQWDQRFSWGEVQIQLEVVKGKIQDIRVWSDAMEVTFSKSLETAWKDVRLSKETMIQALEPLKEEDAKEYEMATQILEFFM